MTALYIMQVNVIHLAVATGETIRHRKFLRCNGWQNYHKSKYEDCADEKLGDRHLSSIGSQVISERDDQGKKLSDHYLLQVSRWTQLN
ncbi:hypothetical protein [Nostoc sp.]|uniref:hypothetical protein n=1 Tax=Nostoc sp. TaxID=1180 RepID=UPI002FF9CEDC